MDADSKAWWIDYYGDIINVNDRHDETILNFPEKFNVTKYDIKKVLSGNKNTDDVEGDIAEVAVYKGNIRIRMLKGLYIGVFIDIDYDACNDSSTKLFNFFDKKANEINLPIYAKVYVFDYSTQTQSTTTIKNFIDELNSNKVFENKQYK